jgi:predicted CoA-binding protein
MKKTLVLGASSNPERYSYLAVHKLLEKGHEVVPVGIQQNARIGEQPILNGQPDIEGVHTVTLYLNPGRQQAYYDYILHLHPERIIFNPGTENPELIQLAKANEIEPVIACTLVMLATDQY